MRIPEQESSETNSKVVPKKLTFKETVQKILAKDGLGALWRGVGPALILVINPVLQYTVFEQLKNFLVVRKTARSRTAELATAVAVLSDWDIFFLGALSKLGQLTSLAIPLQPILTRFCSCNIFDLSLYVC